MISIDFRQGEKINSKSQTRGLLTRTICVPTFSSVLKKEFDVRDMYYSLLEIEISKGI